MTEAETILKLIEECDPLDSSKLDEIDARTLAFVLKEKYLGFERQKDDFVLETDEVTISCPHHTRSRDALKVIRPLKWRFIIETTPDGDAGAIASIEREESDGKDIHITAEAKTEELAELFAIIQAIEYERTHKL